MVRWVIGLQALVIMACLFVMAICYYKLGKQEVHIMNMQMTIGYTHKRLLKCEQTLNCMDAISATIMELDSREERVE